MPIQLYQSHKQVYATPITRVHESRDAVVVFWNDANGAEQSEDVSDNEAFRNAPEPGDYLIASDAEAWRSDGLSHLPKAIFEADYDVIDQQPATSPQPASPAPTTGTIDTSGSAPSATPTPAPAATPPASSDQPVATAPAAPPVSSAPVVTDTAAPAATAPSAEVTSTTTPSTSGS